MRQTLRVNRYMPLDTAHSLARIVAFFHGGIRVPHTLRINNQEGGFFMASLLATCCGHLSEYNTTCMDGQVEEWKKVGIL